MKKISIILLVFVSISFAFAQSKKLTIEDAVSGQIKFLYPEYKIGLKWQAESDNYTYVSDDYQKIMISSPKSKKEKTLLSLDDLNKIMNTNGLDSVKFFYSYTWINKNVLKLAYSNHFIFVDINKKKLVANVELPKEASDVFFCKENNTFAFTLKNNLYIQGFDNKQKQITNDENPGIVNGQTVSRSEFGIDHGIFWSPKGNYLAFYRKDETKVTDYPLVDVNTTPATLKNIKYPMNGQASENIKVGIYDMKTGKTIFLDTGEPNEQYLINPAWSPDEKHIVMAILNRDQNHSDLNLYDAQNGKLIKTLYTEENEAWVEPEKPAFFLNNNQFIWQSERDGYNHMYLFDLKSDKYNQITKGEWVVLNIEKYNPKTNTIYFTSTKDSPIQTNLYSVNIDTKKVKRITQENGTHNVSVNDNFSYIIDGYSNLKTPRVYNIDDINGKELKNIINAENPLKDYNINMPEIGTIKAADGKTDLYYRLIKPSNFDANKKYPVLVYVYGGPHAQLITDSWMGGAQMWLYYMAQEGYLVFTLDNRGSGNRGFDFEKVIHRQCGQEEMKDQIEGIKFISKLPYADTSRIGVDGWSYGGFMTTSLMVNYNKIFKVGVAGGPVIDWKYYEVMYGERYMDRYQENPEGFEKTSLLNKTDKLTGRLMIIHGGMDPTVVWQNSQMFLNQCIKNGVLVDYMIYPNHEHNVRGKDRDHLMRTITRYFNEHLKTLHQ